MPKRNNPETSREAFKALQPEQLRQTYKDILFALSQLGEATTWEIAQALRVPHEKIWKRFKELRDMELIYRPGNKRIMPGGKPGFTHKLTTPGTPSLPVTEKALPGKGVNDYAKQIIQQSTLF